MSVFDQFSLAGKTAIVTGATGVLGGAMAHGLAAAGAKVAILGRRAEKAQEVVDAIQAAGGTALATPADVLSTDSLNITRDVIMAEWGRIDILVNAAGGNMPGATIFNDVTFFNMKEEDFDGVVKLNLNGSLLPTQVFGEVMAEQGSGSVINISSMASTRTLTRVLGYSNAKAAIDSFTKWVAVEFARTYGAGLRVNAIAPGFFVGEQNRAFLLNPDGTNTPRGQLIIDHTPMGRYGEPDELVGTAIWLASDAAKFVTGIVVPVGGGFSAFSGI